MKLTTLAFRNIKRSLKKYVMYFFSLSFSVFTAYTFLGLLYNENVMNVFIQGDRYRSLLMGFGIVIMVFVCFFLISSNNSFIKARKKEISTYSLFGMTNGKIGKLLFIETIMVGFVALLVGIGVGIFLSKLIAMILLDISLSSFTGDIKFTIVPKAIYVTTIVFAAIFSLMGLSGFRVINKFELVDLFKADKVSEGSPKGSIFVLAISLILIGTGYYLALQRDPGFIVAVSIPILLLVVSGTYLFFWGGLPKVLQWIKADKNKYFQGVNLISTTMIHHRMKSIGSVMASIAILSAVATTAIGTGFTLYSGAEKNIYQTLGYDAYFYGGQEEILEDVHSTFEKNDMEIIDEYTFQRYKSKPKINSIVYNNLEYGFGEHEYFRVYSETVYNKLVTISRKDLEPVSIKSGEAMYSYPDHLEALRDGIDGQLLTFSNREIKITSCVNDETMYFGAQNLIVLNDGDFDALVASGDISDKSEGGELFDKATVFKFNNPLKSRSLNSDLTEIFVGKVGSYRTAYNNFNELLETYGLLYFIGLFMSGVFILMTASLLYFKQIMAAEEEKHQFRMLRKIGMDERVETKVIKKRLIPIFLIPLVMGIVHSVFAMKAGDTMVFSGLISSTNSYLTVLSFSAIMYGAYAVVYGVFYLITKAQYARIVK